MIYVKSFNDVLTKVREYEVSTTTKYVLVNSCMKFSQEEKVELTDKLQLHWDDDRTPYFHFGARTYQCHQGRDTNLYQKMKYAQSREKKAQEDHCFIKRYKQAQVSKKLDCPAIIRVTRVIRFSEYKLTGTCSKAAKDKTSRLIKKKIAKGVPLGEEVYAIKFPNQEEHKYHLQGSNAAVVEPVDERVKEHITQLVSRGERNPIVVSKLLEIFVQHELLETDKQRRRFYPALKTVRQVISYVKGKLKTSPIDQENTENMLKKLDAAEHNVFFRPCIRNDDENGESLDEDLGEQKSEISSLLFVYQNKNMSDLYRKYGTNTLLLDATYRTCKYALPLYFAVVETNVNYQIVGVIITQFETKEAITEGLTILKNWNPDIVPKYGMVDYAAEEIASLETVFPAMKVFICTFHREQAWNRWLSKGKDATVPKPEALRLLREVANAPTEKELVAALQKIRAWPVYENTHFKTYFEATWLKEIDRWACALKPLDMHINTNNGVERLNKELKYSHLEGFKNCSLSEIVNVILFSFLPERYSKYVSENLLMTPQWRKYDTSIPQYLHGRPKWLIDRVMAQLSLVTKERAEEVTEANEGVFLVPSMSFDQVHYVVKFDILRKLCSCTCKDFSKARLVCKHVLLVGMKYPNWSLAKIHEWLFSNPVFMYDKTLVTEEQHQIGAESTETSITTTNEINPLELTDKLQLHWDDDRTPYFHFGARTYQCHQGRDTNLYQKMKYAQSREKKAQEDHCFIKRYKQAQVSKKLDCPAIIRVTRVIRFSEYKLTGTCSKAAKDKTSRLIKKKIAKGVPLGEEVYAIKFPNQEEHKYHLQGSNAAVVEPVDERVKEHITQLVSRGERNPIVVSKLLEIFVQHELLETDKQRRRFYPALKTVRQVISYVKGKLKTSPIDQENTENMLKKLDAAEHNVFFRPCIRNDDENGESLDEDLGEQKSEISSLLFVYQNKNMSDLYRKYGTNTLLLDATYRTCKYALPLYFAVVETNVNYQIVGVIITQFETKEAITEGLTILKNWNPDIVPKYGMVDYAAEEINLRA